MKNFPLMEVILKQYQLDMKNGVHGIDHWERVWHIGNTIASANGADKKVVSYFALLHDACREDEGSDTQHGSRAAKFAEENRHLIDLNVLQFNTLKAAMHAHTDGITTKNLTVGSCWDADRLDLGRVWIMPDKDYLSTDAAKDDRIFKWAIKLYQEKRKKVTTWIQ